MNDDERLQKALEIAGRIADLAPEERRKALEIACADDPSMRTRVERLVFEPDPSPAFLAPLIDAPPVEPRVGTTFGDFKLERKLGSGTYGTVFLAREIALNRFVALKVLRTGSVLNQRDLDRVRREAVAVAALSHPHIVRVFSIGSVQDAYYIAFEYIDGADLYQELDRLRSKRGDGILPSFESSAYVPAVVALIADVADALEHAHQRGVVHRDVKPHNLLLDKLGKVYVGDFGLARAESFGSLSQSGVALGSPYYMSPEQVQASRRAIDHRTDVYSLGVVLYEVLTHERPFEGESSEQVMHRVCTAEPRPLRERNANIPEPLVWITTKAIEKRAQDRYATAAAFAADLRAFLEHRATEAKPVSVTGRAVRLARRWPRATVFGLGVVVASLVLWSLSVWKQIARERSDMATVERILDERNRRSVSDSDLLRARELCTQWSADSQSEKVQSLAVRIEQQIASVVAELESTGVQFLRAGLESTDGAEPNIEDALVSEGLRKFERAARLQPSNALKYEQIVSDALQPRLDVLAMDDTGRSVAARVRIATLDPYSGLPTTPIDLGTTPIVGIAVRSGNYRITVSQSGHSPREFVRKFARGTGRLSICCEISNRLDTVDGMILIPSGPYAVGDEESDRGCSMHGSRLQVPAFWIDECEVTVKDYREFLRVSGRQPPWGWELFGMDPKFDELPVIYVSWEDALAYAEWRGKRLLAHAEWEFAARGSDGWLLPWSRELDGRMLGATQGENPSLLDVETSIAIYLRDAHPVRSDLDARTRTGLFHMFGNVAEWVETPWTEEDFGKVSVDPQQKMIMGSGWFAASQPRSSLRWHAARNGSRYYASPFVGFRCGRSATEPAR